MYAEKVVVIARYIDSAEQALDSVRDLIWQLCAEQSSDQTPKLISDDRLLQIPTDANNEFEDESQKLDNCLAVCQSTQWSLRRILNDESLVELHESTQDLLNKAIHQEIAICQTLNELNNRGNEND
jgi:hypothetical protein